MPLVWLGRHFVGSHVDRVYGPDLMLALFEATMNQPFRHFFYGGAPRVAGELKAKNSNPVSPGYKSPEMYTPPFRPLNPDENAELTALVREAKPDLMWVGLEHAQAGTFHGRIDLPKLGTLPSWPELARRSISIPDGSRQAPRWIQRAGLEWLFRMLFGATPPRPCAIWLTIPLFLARLALQAQRTAQVSA